MYAYLLDGTKHEFLALEWKCTYTKEIPLTGVYYKIIQETSYKVVYARVIEFFIIALYELIFGIEAPCMMNQEKGVIADITYSLASPQGTFIRVYGAYKIPHLMSFFITNKVVIQEVRYQLATGLSGSLHRLKKSLWPILPLQIGSYSYKNLKVVEEDIFELEHLSFGEMGYWRYDPRGI